MQTFSSFFLFFLFFHSFPSSFIRIEQREFETKLFDTSGINKLTMNDWMLVITKRHTIKDERFMCVFCNKCSTRNKCCETSHFGRKKMNNSSCYFNYFSFLKVMQIIILLNSSLIRLPFTFSQTLY